MRVVANTLRERKGDLDKKGWVRGMRSKMDLNDNNNNNNIMRSKHFDFHFIKKQWSD